MTIKEYVTDVIQSMDETDRSLAEEGMTDYEQNL